MKKLITLLGVLMLGSSMAWATACTNLTTVSSTGVVDSDSMTWANGTLPASIVYPQQIFSFSALACAGGTFLPQYTTTLNGSGAFSIALPTVSSISPLGSQWALTICPNATSGCYTYTIVTSGSTQDITTALNAVLPGPRFYSQQANFGYTPLELITTVPVGTLFYNTTTSAEVTYNGSTWSNVYGSGVTPISISGATNLVNVTSTVTTSAPGQIRAVIGAATTSNASFADASSSLVGVRGVATIPVSTTATSGYAYGTQGKFVLPGTVNGSLWGVGLLGQLDISTATLTAAAHVAPIWSDAGATGPSASCTFCDNLVVTNTTGTTFNSVLFTATKAAYFVDAANVTNSGGWIAASSATSACTTTYLLKINTPSGAGYVHVCSN